MRYFSQKELNMKKIATIVLTVLLCACVFAGGNKESNLKKIVVGASPNPHAQMLELVKEDLKAKGYNLEVKIFEDYVLPNDAVESGEIDANFFQHVPYMNSFNSEKNYHLVNAGGIHVEPFAVYSKKVTSLSALKNGATIAVPNDPTNEGRALLLLESAGLIKLKDSTKIDSTKEDISSNPKNLKIVEMEAASLPRVLSDVDAAVINGNYALEAGLAASKDGLFIEGADSPYVNIISVKSGNENSDSIKALVKALQSDKVAKWVKENYPNGDVVTVF